MADIQIGDIVRLKNNKESWQVIYLRPRGWAREVALVNRDGRIVSTTASNISGRLWRRQEVWINFFPKNERGIIGYVYDDIKDAVFDEPRRLEKRKKAEVLDEESDYDNNFGSDLYVPIDGKDPGRN